MSPTWDDVQPGDKVTIEVTKTVLGFYARGSHVVAAMAEDKDLDSGTQWAVLGTLADDKHNPIKSIERPSITYSPVEANEENEA